MDVQNVGHGQKMAAPCKCCNVSPVWVVSPFCCVSVPFASLTASHGLHQTWLMFRWGWVECRCLQMPMSLMKVSLDRPCPLHQNPKSVSENGLISI